jgi:hypothetical protein
LAVLSRQHRDLNQGLSLLNDKTRLVVHKGLELMAMIEDSLESHLLFLARFGLVGKLIFTKPGRQMHPFFVPLKEIPVVVAPQAI